MQPSSDIRRLIDIMAALRDPIAGCPWDVQQTFASIVPFTIEEAYEVADAIERGATEDLREELGDLLLQVVFHARMAEEAGLFDFGGVVEAITAKLVRRHPHVFGDAGALSSDEVKALWGRIKAEEKRAKLASEARDGAARRDEVRRARRGSAGVAGAFSRPETAGESRQSRFRLERCSRCPGEDQGGDRRGRSGDRRGFGAGAVERSGRPPIRGREPRPTSQGRSRGRLAQRQRQVRTPLRPYRELALPKAAEPPKAPVSMKWSGFGSRRRPRSARQAEAS